MGSINSITGDIIIHLNDGSFFNSEATIEFIKDIIEENKNKKIALFWDNASIHKSSKTKAFLIDHNIKSILNVPYKPDYNAIENVWAEAKKEFRKQMTLRKIKNEEINLYDVVG
jgi:transposase